MQINLKSSSILKQIFYYGISLVLMKGLSLVMLPVFTHYLSPTEYGQLEILMVLINLVSLVLGMGLLEALYRFAGLADSDIARRDIVTELFTQALLIALLGLLLVLLVPVHDMISRWLPGQIPPTLVRWVLFAILCEALIAIPLAWLRMQEMASFFFMCTTLRVVVQMLFMWLSLHWGMGLEGVVIITCATTVIQALLMGIWLHHNLGTVWRLQGGLKYLRYGIPILVSGLAAFLITGLDRWLLASHVGEAELGCYVVAGKFALAASLFLQPFTLWWYPKRFQCLSDTGGLRKNADFAELGAALGYLFSGFVGFLAPSMIIALTPESYHSATELIPWLVAIMALKTQSELMNMGCFINKDSRLQMNINLLCSVVAVFGYVVSIHHWGMIGVLVTLFIVNGSRMILMLHYSQKLLYLPYRWYGVVSAAALMVVALWLGQEIILLPRVSGV